MLEHVDALISKGKSMIAPQWINIERILCPKTEESEKRHTLGEQREGKERQRVK